MPEDDIDIEKYIGRSFRLLFILFLFFVIFATDSNSSEKLDLDISHIENVEVSLSEIESLQQNIQISLNTKRRTSINSITPNILNTYIAYNSFWCNIKLNVLFEQFKVPFLKKDIIHLYCVLLI